MAEASEKRDLATTSEQILAEHRRIRDLSFQIQQCPDLATLIERLQAFRALLELHFMTEEIADGLYDMIRAMAPRQLGKVDLLQKEHRTFLADLDRVVEEARQCLAGPVADVQGRAGALARRLLAHEASEDELLVDTMYTDLGQGD